MNSSIATIRQKFFWLITVSIIGITILIYLSDRACKFDELYRELYYFPIFIAAMRYGKRGAMTVLAVILLLYTPRIILTWGDGWKAETARLAELLFYLMFAIGAGYFADREKQVKAELDRNRFMTSLGRITSGIVHDLKNPLISIIGLLERLAAGKGDCTRYVPVILQDAHRMERIVYDVLDFAKPINLRKRQCNLSEVVKNAIKMCREKAGIAKVSMDAEIDDVLTLADSFLMERALVNVISNAVEASGKGGKIQISLHRQASSARIVIRDYGQGMDKDTMEHCFEPYFSHKANGTGLGLPIVKKIVEAHGGSISVELPPEGGTAFQIDLPI